MMKRKGMALVWAAAAGIAIQTVNPALGAEMEAAGIQKATSSGASRGTPPNAQLEGEKQPVKDAWIAGAAAVKAAARASSTGDLWDHWEGDMDFPGLGTKTEPYQISSLAQLMGLSEAVAAGIDFKGKYFEMIQDIDLGNLELNNGSWNPIGWYQNEEEIGNQVSHGFSGNFDGCGNTIWGLKLHRPGTGPDYAGLFGLIHNGSVRNLRIEGAEIYGGHKAAVLAGEVTGDSRIYDVQVSGYVRASGDAGGIAGNADGEGSRVIIENCRAEGIALLSEGGSACVGGITGQAVKADLIDNTAVTQDGSGDRIQGKGYTGGIAGRMRQTNIYNSYVDGTIGGNGGKAVGGIVGLYESGDLIVARFAGDIGRTHNGSMSRKGTFVGTRQGTFTYGTEKKDNLSYLFTNTAGKAKTVFGSGMDGDNLFTKYAHIGYWTDNETKYVTVAGVTETGCGDRYFYEELEDGVRYLTTQKVNHDFPGDPDHFAPGYQGEPVRGYLVSVPRIDAVNANGTYDIDVASLSAIASGVNTYYRTIDKDHSGAVAPGATVTVATAARNTERDRYQMVLDTMEPGGVVPPTYTDESGNPVPMTYVNGGSYSFEMPSCDTELRAEYVKVTTKLAVSPEETRLLVTQTRKGDRKNPDILTEVRNQEGVLIARYINGNQDQSVEVQPVRIHGEHNQEGNTADRTITWSVDDSDLLVNMSPAESTMEDARIMPNLEGTFIQGIIRREEEKQADSGYEEAISPIVYEQSGVVTAASNPKTSADHQAVYGNCKVTVALQILDQTTRRVEGLNLNLANMDCTVTRTLKGDRKNPVETITCSMPEILAAELFPRHPFHKNVAWKDKNSGQIIMLSPMGEHQENCRLSLRFDPEGKANPAWIQNVIQKDNERKKEDPYRKLEGRAEYYETITATSQDQTHGVVSASCNVTIHFVTDDQTEIMPEQVKAEPAHTEYRLTVAKIGDCYSPALKYEGFEETALKAQVLPDCPQDPLYRPYNSAALWESKSPEVLKVSGEGVMEPLKEASWIQEALETASRSADRKAEAVKTVEVEAKAGSQKDRVKVVLHLTAKDETVRRQSSGGSSSGSPGGGSLGGSSAGSTGGPGVEGIFTGNSVQVPKASLPGTGLGEGQGIWVQTVDGYWTFMADGRVCRDEWAYIQNPYADPQKGQNTFDWFRFDEKGHMVTGWFTDQDGRRYYLNPKSDNTLGRMFVGWNWIPGKDGAVRCYYFQEKSDGYKGSLYENKTTPDGYDVNKEGAWTVENEVQVK